MKERSSTRWSGQVMESIDGLEFIGRNPGDAEHIYIATGDSGMGMTHGTIAGLLISDLILKPANPWPDPLRPGSGPREADRRGGRLPATRTSTSPRSTPTGSPAAM